jgi:hypothetical protein
MLFYTESIITSYAVINFEIVLLIVDLVSYKVLEKWFKGENKVENKTLLLIPKGQIGTLVNDHWTLSNFVNRVYHWLVYADDDFPAFLQK